MSWLLSLSTGVPNVSIRSMLQSELLKNEAGMRGQRDNERALVVEMREASKGKEDARNLSEFKNKVRKRLSERVRVRRGLHCVVPVAV